MIKYSKEETVVNNGILLIPMHYSIMSPFKTFIPKGYINKFDNIALSIRQYNGPAEPGVMVRFDAANNKNTLYATFTDCIAKGEIQKDLFIDGIKFFVESFNNQGIHPNFHIPTEALVEVGVDYEWLEMWMIDNFLEEENVTITLMG